MTPAAAAREVVRRLACGVGARIAPPPGLWFFAFHSVGVGDHPALQAGRLELRPEVFASSLRWISTRFSVVTCTQALDQLQSGLSPDARLAVITFDDGYRGVGQHAWPYLRDACVPFTVYVNSAMVEKGELMWRHRAVFLQTRRGSDIAADDKRFLQEAKSRFEFPATVDRLDAIWRRHVSVDDERTLARDLYLGWDDLDEMCRDHPARVTIGNHTAHHWILSRLPEERASSEIASCGRALSSRFSTVSPCLAVPHGDWRHTSPRVNALIVAAGYRPLLGVGGWHAPTDTPPGRFDPIRRVHVSPRRPPSYAVLEASWERWTGRN